MSPSSSSHKAHRRETRHTRGGEGRQVARLVGRDEASLEDGRNDGTVASVKVWQNRNVDVSTAGGASEAKGAKTASGTGLGWTGLGCFVPLAKVHRSKVSGGGAWSWGGGRLGAESARRREYTRQQSITAAAAQTTVSAAPTRPRSGVGVGVRPEKQGFGVLGGDG